MNQGRIPGVIEKGSGGPLILLFSPRNRIRDILAIGLVQCNYRIILADSSHLALIKTNQFLPDLVILDITTDNTNDILLISRFQKSIRTRNIPILTIVPSAVRQMIDRIRLEDTEKSIKENWGVVHILEYPFNFADVQKEIKQMLITQQKSCDGSEPEKIDPEKIDRDRLAGILFNTQISSEKKIQEIENRLHKQWVFPYTVIKALDILESDASCCSDLAKCIKTDLSASTAILKVANTVFYAKRGGKRVIDIQEAVVRLGFRETRNLLASLALIDLSPDLYRNYGFTRQEFWLHSLSTALIAEKLCIDCGYNRPELAFLSGLIHDLGKIPIDNNLQSVFMNLLEETADKVVAFFETEESLMGFTHASLAHYLATKWNFPPAVCLTILYHHDVERIIKTSRPVDRILQASVYVANILAKTVYMGHSCDEIIQEIPASLLRDLNITDGVGNRFFTAVYRNLCVLCRYLNLPTQGLALSKFRKDMAETEVAVVYDENITFHPISLALMNSGYNVKVTNQFSCEKNKDTKVAFFISKRGTPLDIMLYEDEEENIKGEQQYLKIYLLDVIPSQNVVKQMMDRNIVFLDRRHLDLRFVINMMDQFLQKVVLPEIREIDVK